MKRFLLLFMVLSVLGSGVAQAAPAAPTAAPRTPTVEMLVGNMGFQLFDDWSACISSPGTPIIVGAMTAQGFVFGSGTQANVAWFPGAGDGGPDRCAVAVLPVTNANNAAVTYTFVGTTYMADKPLQVECHQIAKVGQFSPVCKRLTP